MTLNIKNLLNPKKKAKRIVSFSKEGLRKYRRSYEETERKTQRRNYRRTYEEIAADHSTCYVPPKILLLTNKIGQYTWIQDLLNSTDQKPYYALPGVHDHGNGTEKNCRRN